MKLITCFLTVSCFCISQLQSFAQVSNRDEGLVTYTLGTDTTVSQYYSLSGNQFKTTVVLLSGTPVKLEGKGELDKSGDLKQVQSKTFAIDSSGEWKLVSEASNVFTGDSSVYTVTSNGKIVYRRAVPGKGIVSNAADACSFYVFPYMGHFAPQKNGDTLFHCQLSFGECRKYMVARVSKNELSIGSNVMGKIKLYVDDNGRMTRADAIGSSLNFIASVKRDKNDPVAWMNALAKRKFLTGTTAPKTFRDTAVLVSGNKKIEIDYWRPYRRNRQIFGAVVPWNRFWRTGANNATQLRTNVDLVVDGTILPAGKYSLWTYPTETDWQLMINSKADVWGTEYDPKADIIHIPLHVEKMNDITEILKISLLPAADNEARLVIEWENYRVWADMQMN